MADLYAACCTLQGVICLLIPGSALEQSLGTFVFKLRCPCFQNWSCDSNIRQLFLLSQHPWLALKPTFRRKKAKVLRSGFIVILIK